ncbi:hypothetical protein PINS_up008351 [Pythium insidiosum]|nr:hypothetical protein PINS_up008351 [Pythium insidiosum]
MWMSDKRPIQEELSTNLSLLMHKIPTVELSLAFVHSFLRTMQREWHGIDGLRLDKFYSLVRKFVHQTFVLLQTHEWDSEHVARVVAMFTSEVTTRVPNGLRLHVTDLFLTELHGAAAETIDTVSFLQLLEPFFALLSTDSDKPVQKRVREMIFLYVRTVVALLLWLVMLTAHWMLMTVGRCCRRTSLVRSRRRRRRRSPRRRTPRRTPRRTRRRKRKRPRSLRTWSSSPCSTASSTWRRPSTTACSLP